MNAYMNDDIKPFMLKSRKTAAPKLRVGFRSNGNGHVDAADLSRTAALACAVANCLFSVAMRLRCRASSPASCVVTHGT